MMIRRDLVDKWKGLKVWIADAPFNFITWIVNHVRGICIFSIVSSIISAIISLIGLVIGDNVTHDAVRLAVNVFCIVILFVIVVNYDKEY